MPLGGTSRHLVRIRPGRVGLDRGSFSHVIAMCAHSYHQLKVKIHGMVDSVSCFKRRLSASIKCSL